MDPIQSFSPCPPLREPLIAGLVRQVCRCVDGDDDLGAILRTCVGAALAHDLSPGERHWLIAGVERQLDVLLMPATQGA